MKDNTIDTHSWQLYNTSESKILIQPRVIAKYVIWHLQQIPAVRGVGTQAVALTHPLAWQYVDIISPTHVRVPVAFADDTEIVSQITAITRILQAALDMWLATTVHLEVHFVTTVVAPHVASEKDTARGTH